MIDESANQSRTKLPFRLLPNRRALPVSIALSLLGCAAVAYLLWKPAQQMMNIAVSSPTPVPLVIMGLVSVGLVPAILLRWIGVWLIQLIPGSPYYYVEVDHSGIAIRKLLRIKRYKWADLSAFAVAKREIATKYGSRTEYVTVALHATDAVKLIDESERWRNARLRIRADEYSSGKAELAAGQLANWLNEIREIKVESIQIPTAFRDTVYRKTAPLAAAPRGPGVIER